MRRLYAILIMLVPVVCAMTIAAQGQDVLSSLAVYPTLIVYNARIHAMDAGLSSYEAMALRGSRIWKLGGNDEIRALAGPATELIDAKQHVILPGLIDAHTHPHVWGAMHWGYKYDPQLQWLYVEAKDLPELKTRLQERVSERIRQGGTGKWIVAPIPRGLGPQALAAITRADLDRMAPDNPLVMVTGLIGGLLVNTKARQETQRLLGIDLTLEDSILLWFLIPYDIVLKGRTAQVADLLSREMEELVPLGVTTIMSNVGSAQVLSSANYLDRRGKMPVRWAWVHRSGFARGENPAEFYSLLGDFAGQGSEFFWNIGVGEEAWDSIWCTSLQPRTQALRDQQQRDILAGHCQSVPGARLYEGHLAAARSGLRLADSHLYGDIALNGAIRIADTLIREDGLSLDQIRDQKWGFDHAYFIPPESIPLFVKYGFWMSFQSRAITREDRIAQTYGPEYVPWVLPVKAWLDAGARFTLNTDAHLTLGSTPEERLQENMIGKALWDFWPDQWRNTVWPWLGVWTTREINGRQYSPEKKLDRTTVLKAWTVWPAEFVLRSGDLGSLEPGKLGDFIVIDRDYFTIPESEIQKIETLLTVIDGKVRFKSTKF